MPEQHTVTGCQCRPGLGDQRRNAAGAGCGQTGDEAARMQAQLVLLAGRSGQAQRRGKTRIDVGSKGPEIGGGAHGFCLRHALETIQFERFRNILNHVAATVCR